MLRLLGWHLRAVLGEGQRDDVDSSPASLAPLALSVATGWPLPIGWSRGATFVCGPAKRILAVC